MNHYLFNARRQLQAVTADETNARLSCVLRPGWWRVTDAEIEAGALDRHPDCRAQVEQWRQQTTAR